MCLSRFYSISRKFWNDLSLLSFLKRALISFKVPRISNNVTFLICPLIPLLHDGPAGFWKVQLTGGHNVPQFGGAFLLKSLFECKCIRDPKCPLQFASQMVIKWWWPPIICCLQNRWDLVFLEYLCFIQCTIYRNIQYPTTQKIHNISSFLNEKRRVSDSTVDHGTQHKIITFANDQVAQHNLASRSEMRMLW